MSLQPIQQTEGATASQVANAIVNQIMLLTQRVEKLRDEGLPAIPATPEKTLPNGQVLPARPAVPAVSVDAINAALGADNCALLDSLKAAIKGI